MTYPFRIALLVTSWISASGDVHLVELAESNKHYGLLNSDREFLVNGFSLSTMVQRANEHRGIAKFLTGAKFIDNLDTSLFRLEEDPFLVAWDTWVQNRTNLELLQQLYPTQGTGKRSYVDLKTKHHHPIHSSKESGFAYDAIMMTGFGPCKEEQDAVVAVTTAAGSEDRNASKSGGGSSQRKPGNGYQQHEQRTRRTRKQKKAVLPAQRRTN